MKDKSKNITGRKNCKKDSSNSIKKLKSPARSRTCDALTPKLKQAIENYKKIDPEFEISI